MHKITFIFLWVFFSYTIVNAQEQRKKSGMLALIDSTEDTEIPDSAAGGFSHEVFGDTTVTFRSFVLSRYSLAAWKIQKEYRWINNLDSLLHDEEKKSKNKSQRTEYRSPSLAEGILDSAILKWILWIIAGSVVGFIIYQLFLSRGIFGTASAKAVKESDDEVPENIADKDFNYFLNKAYAAGDLRTATRYLFLMTLQKLDQKELIRFGADKTNSTYMYELPPAQRNDFATLSLYYEYIWYGKAPVQKETFDMIRERFNHFFNKL